VGISAALGVGPRVGAAGALAAVAQLVTSRWP